MVAGIRATGWDVEVTVDGDRVASAGAMALMVGIGNGATIGGGTPLCPAADLSDGLLDVVVVGASGPVDRLRFGLALRRGRHLERDDVHRVRGREVSVTGDAVRHNVDGEISDPLTERTYRVEPGAWTVVAP